MPLLLVFRRPASVLLPFCLCCTKFARHFAQVPLGRRRVSVDLCVFLLSVFCVRFGLGLYSTAPNISTLISHIFNIYCYIPSS